MIGGASRRLSDENDLCHTRRKMRKCGQEIERWSQQAWIIYKTCVPSSRHHKIFDNSFDYLAVAAQLEKLMTGDEFALVATQTDEGGRHLYPNTQGRGRRRRGIRDHHQNGGLSLKSRHGFYQLGSLRGCYHL